jgi:cell wall assembly regulator SMI1
MKKTLEILFRKSIELSDENYTNDQIEAKWIGNPPACATDIENAENRLGIKLPNDYVEMITIANGFPTCSNSVEPSFQKAKKLIIIEIMNTMS